MVDCCFNCATPCYAPYLGRITTFYIKSPSTGHNVQVNVAMALSVVFEGALKYTKAQIPINEGGPPEQSIGLCVNCAPTLIDLYSCYIKFMALSTATSAFAKAIWACRLWSFNCSGGGADAQINNYNNNGGDDDSDIEILEVKVKEEPGHLLNPARRQPLVSNVGDVVIKIENLEPTTTTTTVEQQMPRKKVRSASDRRKIKTERQRKAREVLRAQKAAAKAASGALKCPHCPNPNYYIDQVGLEKHITKAHPSKCKHPCDICNKSFLTLERLSRHQRFLHQISPPKTLPCSICHKSVVRAKVKYHMRFVHGVDYVPPSCQYCGATFKSDGTLYLHLQKAHPIEILAANNESENINLHPSTPSSPAPAERCQSSNNNATVSSQQQRRPARHGYNFCRLCKIQHKNKLEFLQHKLLVHPEASQPKKFTCSEEGCVRTFYDRLELLVHENVVHGKTEGDELLAGRTCSVCNKKFPYPSYLKTHQEKGSCQPKIINCAKCGEEFESRLTLRDHYMNVHQCEPPPPLPEQEEKPEKKYHCEPCGKSFLQRKSWRQHAFKIHSQIIPSLVPPKSDLPPTCGICGKIYKDRKGLRYHNLVVHQGIKKARSRSKSSKCKTVHLCNICGATISWSTNFYKHLKLKHGVGTNGAPSAANPVVCHICGKSFVGKSTLKQHLRSNAHGDSEMKYQCSICGRLYAVEANYLKHLKLHSFIMGSTSTTKSTPVSSEADPTSGSSSSLLSSSSLACEECGAIFNQTGNLKRHLFTVHGLGVYANQEASSATPYVCSHCGRGFKIKTQLDQHLRTKQHGGPGLDVGRRPRVKNPKRIVLNVV